MRTNMKNQAGMSLVEATIILLVLATLTAVIAPSMGDYLEDARQHKVKEDIEALGIGIVRLVRDTGLRGLKMNAAVGFTEANRADTLKSAEGTEATNASAAFADVDIDGGQLEWDHSNDTFENQLVHNYPGGDTDGS